MKRKLVKQGENAITVTLPSKWIKLNNLEPKDEVDIREDGSNLIVTTDSKKSKKKITITLKSNDQKYIDALFRNFYINGYDEIYVKFNSNEEYLKITKTIDPLIGYEIESRKEKSCFVKNISEFEDNNYESIFKKIIYIIFTIEELTTELIENRSKNFDYEQIIQLNKDSSKFSCFARRIIFKSDILKNEDALTKYTIINTLHMIARNYNTIYKYIVENKVKLTKKEITYFNKVKDYFRKLFDSYTNNDLKLTNEVMKNRKLLIKTGLDLANDSKNFTFIHYLMEIIRLTGTIAGKIGFLNSLKQ